MKHNIGKAGLIALTIFFMANASHATTSEVVSKDDKTKPAHMKWVDINSASKAELKTLQGIDDALAAKIMAGRPYLSKANLVTHNIIPAGLYVQLKQQIIAKQK